MANKLPWYTHDHNARNDEFLQKSMDRFGHFGYSSYFIILELIHQYGVGGTLLISKSRLALNLRSRWPQVRLYLDFSQTSGKVEFKLIGDEVELKNKKFIERQAKMKSKTPSTLPQHSLNTPLEREREGEGEREKEKTTKSAPKGAPEITPIERVVMAYKLAKN